MKTKRIILGLAAALVVVGGGGYWYLRSTVTLENNASCELSGITIQMADETVWTGTLKAGESATVHIRPGHEASFRVAGSCDGNPVDSGSVGYVSSGAPEAHSITYSDNRFTYRSRGKI